MSLKEAAFGSICSLIADKLSVLSQSRVHCVSYWVCVGVESSLLPVEKSDLEFSIELPTGSTLFLKSLTTVGILTNGNIPHR